MGKKILDCLAWSQEPLVGILWTGLAILHPNPWIQAALGALAVSRFAKVIQANQKADDAPEHVGGGITSSVTAQEMHR